MAKQEKPDPKKVGVRVKKKITRTVPAGIVQVKATFNNTIISITGECASVLVRRWIRDAEVRAVATPPKVRA